MSARAWSYARLCACALFVCAWACGATVRLATWNVRNYNICDRMVEGRFYKAYPKPESEKAALRAVVRAYNPDVLALQEIGAGAFLEELRRDLRLAGIDYPYAVQIETADPKHTLAVLSRVPFSQVVRHDPLPTAFGIDVRRGALETAFETNGIPWRLYTVHLKSRITTLKRDSSAARQRRAEAEAVAALADKRAGACCAVAGDFNDTIDSATLAAFTDGGRFAPVAAFDAQGADWTHFYAAEQRRSRFDFLLLSPALHARVRASGVADAPRAMRASDHRLVYADIEF